jgi:hypothetical protein
MPTTPGCQPSPAAQTSGASSPRASACASAASRTRASISRRSVLSVSSRRGQRHGLLRVVGGQQPRAQIGLPDPAACIDAGAQDEAEVIAVGGRSSRATSQSATSPLRCRRAITVRPCRTKARFTPRAAPHRPRWPAPRGRASPSGRGPRRPVGADAVEVDQQQEHHGGRAEMAERAVLVLPVGVHHGDAIGQRRPRRGGGRARSRPPPSPPRWARG